MRSFFRTSLAAIALFLPSTFAAVTVTAVQGEVVADSYIVKLKPNANRDNHLARVQDTFARSRSRVDIAYKSEFYKGYSGVFRGAALERILNDDDVEYVVPNSIISVNDVQEDAPWGLQSISQREPLGRTDTGSLNFKYTFDASAGQGVDVYVVDTGVFIEHQDFEGRATFGFAAGTFQKKDGHGHGTHCAGTIAGKKYGVAKKANVIGVKVLSDSGSGSVADIVAGLQYVVSNTAATGKPSLASMSLGGGANTALDDGVKAVLNAGIPVIIAAGNSNVDAQNTSPARVAEAITVGASTISNARSSFSNYGAVVDIFAPGTNVISAWIGSVSATNNISGTSMATPHVAGLSAYLFSKEGKLSPAALSARLKELGTRNVLTGLPSGTTNLLAFNGGLSAPPSSPPTSSTPTPTSTPPSSTPPSSTPPSSTPPTPTQTVVTVTVTPTLTLTLTI